MNQVDRDSVISVSLGQTSQDTKCSEARLQQLASARTRAAEVRKARQRERLETRLAELRCLGDLSNDHLSRVAQSLIACEQEGRARTNKLVLEINTNIEDMQRDITTIRTTLERIITRSQSSTPVRTATAR